MCSPPRIMLQPVANRWCSLPQIKRRKLLTWELPNALNQSFDYYTACIAAMLVYLPGTFDH